MDEDGSAYYHLLSGFMILVICLITFIIGLMVYVLWQAGITVFLGVISAITAFSWLTHRVAVYAMRKRKDWFYWD